MGTGKHGKKFKLADVGSIVGKKQQQQKFYL